MEYRLEHDTMGEVRVPADRYWGAQTQRSFENFRIGTEKIPPEVIRAFAVVKLAAARANAQLGVLDARRAGAGLYITADLKYNDFMTPDKALTVADIGHFESEYCAIRLLFDILSKNLCTFAVRKSECSRNPVNYLV